MLAVIAALLLWLAVTSVTRGLLERRTHAALEQLVAKQPLLATFPLRLDFDHGKSSVAVSGIEPSQLETAPVLDALAAAAAPARSSTASAWCRRRIRSRHHRPASRAEPDAPAGEPRPDARNAERAGEVGRPALAGLTAQYDKLGEQYAGLGEQYAKLQSVADGPAARLGRFIASTAIFFVNNIADEFL